MASEEDQSLTSDFRKYNEGRHDIAFVENAEQSDLVVVFENWSFKLWDHKDSLRDCSFVRDFWEKVFTINCDDHGRGYLRGCYTSLTTRNFDRNLHRSCSYPYNYNALLSQPGKAPIATSSPKLLFSFRGTIRSHPVRRSILRELSGYENGRIEYVDQVFHKHTDLEKREFANEILDSSFVLCPRGWSPTTYRLFEVMEAGRCPVIISDEWVPIEGINWKECALRINESAVRRIPEILAHRIDDAERLGANARKTWERYFSPEGRNKYYLDCILDLNERGRQIAPISFDEAYERWNSWSFYWSNGWTIPQRVSFKLSKTIRSMYGT